MINLLPPEVKTAYKYGRLNVTLERWALAGLVALIGLGIISTYGLLTFRQSNKNYNSQIASIQSQLQKAKLTQTKKQTQDISNSLKLSVKVLGSEVLFSKLISQIGAVLPDGAILTDLNINTAQTGVNIVAKTTTYSTATQIQVNLTDPKNEIFSKVDIVSIACANSNDPYPCTAQLRAQFNTKNQFLFINQAAK